MVRTARHLFSATIFIACLHAFDAKSQIFLCPGDTVCLTLGNYYGNIQWQISADNVNWTDVSGAVTDTSCIIAADSSYYRAVITDGSCDPYYSDTSYVMLSHLSTFAGTDTLVCGDSIMIGGNPTAFNGIPPYSYAWSPSSGLSDSTTSNPMADASSNATYFLTVTDSAGCSAFDTVVVGPAPDTTNPSAMPTGWWTSTYQYGYEFHTFISFTVKALEYVYNNSAGISGNLRIYTAGGNLLSSTPIVTTGTSNWEYVPITPITLNAISDYVVVVDLNNSNAGGNFATPNSVTYDNSVFQFTTGRYNNQQSGTFPFQTWGGYWGNIKMIICQ